MPADKLLDFFEQALAAFHEVDATQDVPVDIAGSRLLLRFGSSRLAERLLPPLSHQVAAAGPCDYTVCIWEGFPMPTPPWMAYGRRGEIAGLPSERLRAALSFAGCSLSMLDRERRLALYWTAAADDQPGWERGAPMRALLSWMLCGPNRHVVHGAAVGRSQGGVVLAGKGGSGKSTSTLSCLTRAALGYVGDDYTVLAGATAHTLYRSARVCYDSLFRVPHLRHAIHDQSDDKALLLVPPERVLRQVPMRAILLPVLGASQTALSPATEHDAFRALSISSMAQLPWAGHDLVNTIKTCVAQVPCHFLHIGPNLDHLADLVDSLCV